MPALGYTAHCFDDGVHMDCCTMVEHADKPSDPDAPAIDLHAPLGPGLAMFYYFDYLFYFLVDF